MKIVKCESLGIDLKITLDNGKTLVLCGEVQEKFHKEMYKRNVRSYIGQEFPNFVIDN